MRFRKFPARRGDFGRSGTCPTLLFLVSALASAQQAYRAPRNAFGGPDLQGVWQAGTTASFNLEAHGAALGIRAGKTVVVDPVTGEIPYQKWALDKRAE